MSLNPHPQPPAIDWSPVPGAETYDLVMGDLSALGANGLTGAVLGCLANDIPGTSFPAPVPLQPGQGSGSWPGPPTAPVREASTPLENRRPDRAMLQSRRRPPPARNDLSIQRPLILSVG